VARQNSNRIWNQSYSLPSRPISLLKAVAVHHSIRINVLVANRRAAAARNLVIEVQGLPRNEFRAITPFIAGGEFEGATVQSAAVGITLCSRASANDS